jgi:hypothetical protein
MMMVMLVPEAEQQVLLLLLGTHRQLETNGIVEK